MHLKRLLILCLLLSLSFLCNAQNFSPVILSLSPQKDTIKKVELVMGNVTLGVGLDGSICVTAASPANYLYHSPLDGRYRRGKLKAIGSLAIDYYDDFNGENTGKIKSVGTTKIFYFDRFGDKDKIGRIRSIGNVNFD